MKNRFAAGIQFLIPMLVCAGTFLVLWSIAGSQPLGHDEAVYLTKARSWIEPAPADEFEVYRPIGMPVFGWFFLQFGNFGNVEQAMRMFGVLFGAVTALFIYLFYKRMVNALVALGITATVVASPLFLQQAPQFLNDVPSSGLLIGVLWLIYIHYKTEGKSMSLYAAAPLLALAFYIRYGTISTFGVIGLISLIVLVPAFIKKENAQYDIVKYTGIGTLVLFTPHFVQALIVEKDLFGILLRAGEVAGRAYVGEGLVDYLRWLPHELGGYIIGITAIAGIAATIVIAYKKNLQQEYRGLLWIGGIGLGNLVLTGILVHAEARYVFFSVVLLSGAGITGMYYMVRRKSNTAANAAAAVFLAVVSGYGVVQYNKADAFFEAKETDRYRVAYVEVSEFIRRDSANEDGCALWAITTYRPAVSWYSRCNTFIAADKEQFEKNFLAHEKSARYSIVLSKAAEEQIDTAAAADFGVRLAEVYRTDNLADADRGDIVVYRMEKNDFETSADDAPRTNTGLDWLPL